MCVYVHVCMFVCVYMCIPVCVQCKDVPKTLKAYNINADNDLVVEQRST